MHFENSASYSRHYQAAQDCMCDTEHMFECPNPNNIMDGSMVMDDDYNTFFQQPLKVTKLFVIYRYLIYLSDIATFADIMRLTQLSYIQML